MSRYAKSLFVPAVALAAAASPAAAAVIVTDPGDSIEAVRHNLEQQYSDFTSYPAGEEPTKAIDRNPATKYLNFDGDDNETGIIVTLSRGPTKIDGFRLATGNDEPNRDPMTIVIQGATRFASANEALTTDGDGDYTTIFTGVTGLAADPGRDAFGPLITFPESAAYSTYRVFMTSIRQAGPGGADSMQVGEIELYNGATATVPEPATAGVAGAAVGVGLLARRRQRR